MNFMQKFFNRIFGFFKPKRKEEIDDVEWFYSKRIQPIMPKVEPRKDGKAVFSIKENPYFAKKTEETIQEYIEQINDNNFALDFLEDLEKNKNMDLEREDYDDYFSIK